MNPDEKQRSEDESPTLEELIGYHDGRLTPAEEDAIRDKLVASPEAVDQLLALHDLASKARRDPLAGEDLAAGAVEAAWADVEARLNDREGFAPKREEPMRIPVFSEGPRRSLTLAASLALAVLGLGLICGWLLLDRRSLVIDRENLQRYITALSEPQVNVAVVELSPPGWSRGFGEGEGFDLPTDATVVHILLNLPQPTAGDSFSLRISDDAGATIWQAEGLVATIENTVAIALKTQLLTRRKYRLELMPDEDSAGRSTVHYQLEINSPAPELRGAP